MFVAQCKSILSNYCKKENTDDECDCTVNLQVVTPSQGRRMRGGNYESYEVIYTMGNDVFEESMIQLMEAIMKLNSTSLSGMVESVPELLIGSDEKYSCTKLLKEPCILWNKAGKCLNSGTCIQLGGRAACKCSKSYSGEFCNEPVVKNMLLIIIACVLIAIIGIILVAFFVWRRMIMKKSQLPDYESAQMNMPNIKPAYYPQYNNEHTLPK